MPVVSDDTRTGHHLLFLLPVPIFYTSHPSLLAVGASSSERLSSVAWTTAAVDQASVARSSGTGTSLGGEPSLALDGPDALPSKDLLAPENRHLARAIGHPKCMHFRAPLRFSPLQLKLCFKTLAGSTVALSVLLVILLLLFYGTGMEPSKHYWRAAGSRLVGISLSGQRGSAATGEGQAPGRAAGAEACARNGTRTRPTPAGT